MPFSTRALALLDSSSSSYLADTRDEVLDVRGDGADAADILLATEPAVDAVYTELERLISAHNVCPYQSRQYQGRRNSALSKSALSTRDASTTLASMRSARPGTCMRICVCVWAVILRGRWWLPSRSGGAHLARCRRAAGAQSHGRRRPGGGSGERAASHRRRLEGRGRQIRKRECRGRSFEDHSFCVVWVGVRCSAV